MRELDGAGVERAADHARNGDLRLAESGRRHAAGGDGDGARGRALGHAGLVGHLLLLSVLDGAELILADTLGLDAVQLSGNEPSEQALEITRPVLKVIHVQPGVEPETLLEECEVGTAALYLLDTAMSGAAGGTGRTFEWELAAAVARQMPCVLAGGLTPDNVADAVRKVRPWGVDVSSGIESDGVKDEAKMRGFVTAVRDADERIFREQE